MKSRILTVVGARPQFVKAAVVSRALRAAQVDEILVHTGQHFDANMSDVFFQELGISPPKHQLGVHSLSHGALTGRMLEGLEGLIRSEAPTAVLVYGDTDSTLAGALAAAKLHVPVVHVEAGLRSGDMKMPEEINRTLTDRVSRLLLCPTHQAVANLEREGYAEFDVRITNVGDVMYDSVLRERAKLQARPAPSWLPPPGSFALLTLHRAENTNDASRFDSIFAAVSEIAAKLPVVWPVHPRTRKLLEGRRLPEGLNTVDPVGYHDMLRLLENCRAVLTDSGGLQKEAYFFAKPCLTLREQTEWVELVEAGANRVVGSETDRILSGWRSALASDSGPWPKNLYGDGRAGEKIAAEILKAFG